MIKTLSQALRMDKERFKVPKSVQQAIPIQRIWPDGIFQQGTKFSKTYRFTDINYYIASKDNKTEMFLDYSELLNSLDSGISAKITINNRRINKEELQKSDVKDIVQADHLADTLLQNISLGKVINSAVEGNVLRDQLMAENVLWILSMEEQRGNSCIFISGHNGHIERFGNYGAGTRVMGNILSDELGDGYFAIGTDFYKTNCNLPKNDGKRITHTFYSYDPLAKAAKKAGYDMSWLDFSKVPENSQLKEHITDHVSMGSLGEGYSAFFMSIFPQSYRVSQSPEKLYDGMIFVTDAHPIEILEEISEK